MVVDMTVNINSFAPGKQLYLDVRVAFVAAETTLNAWCCKNGISPTNARQCLLGSWDGPKAKQLRFRLLEAAGILKKQEGCGDGDLKQGAA